MFRRSGSGPTMFCTKKKFGIRNRKESHTLQCKSSRRNKRRIRTRDQIDGFCHETCVQYLRTQNCRIFRRLRRAHFPIHNIAYSDQRRRYRDFSPGKSGNSYGGSQFHVLSTYRRHGCNRQRSKPSRSNHPQSVLYGVLHA